MNTQIQRLLSWIEGNVPEELRLQAAQVVEGYQGLLTFRKKVWGGYMAAVALAWAAFIVAMVYLSPLENPNLPSWQVDLAITLAMIAGGVLGIGLMFVGLVLGTVLYSGLPDEFQHGTPLTAQIERLAETHAEFKSWLEHLKLADQARFRPGVVACDANI